MAPDVRVLPFIISGFRAPVLVCPPMSDHSEASVVGHTYDEKKITLELSLQACADDELDGGRSAWLTILGTFFIQFCTLGSINAFGVYQDYYTRYSLSNKTPSEISWIGSFQLCMQYAPGILVGRAFDAGYFHHMIALGSVLQVASIFMISLTQKHQYYQVFLAQAVASGLGQSLLFLPSLSIIGQHFKRRRAFATGVGVSGASLGGVIWPIILNQLRQRTSFESAVRVTGAIAGVLLALANIVMKLKPHATGATAPKFKVILTDWAFMASIGGAFVVGLGLFFPYFYLQLYAVDKGVHEGLAFYVLALMNSGSLGGRLLPNFIADRVGPYNMMIPCLAISSALAFSIFGIKTVADVVVFAILYGFWSGSYVSLVPSLILSTAGNPGEYGTRMGVAFSIVSVSMLVGTPISGALLNSTSTVGYVWYKPIIFCGTMLACGSAIFSFSRYLFVRDGRGGARGRLV
ncbi:major facilitator superfamily domain-containing protein [Mycena belliarum]|uniref:Major facilitator superfamily domain-containing protein n=1 Tax=Mycena belliarum TaxID=1033014 RepID=A0AAD6XKH2_9AGAR|nr:major facilitator superfamily domain-containing protein [Mycena belliae]